MNNEDKMILIEKIKKAASIQITKGVDFLYENSEFNIKWKEVLNLIDTIPVHKAPVIKPVENVKEVE
jgi:hypothetical protein